MHNHLPLPVHGSDLVDNHYVICVTLLTLITVNVLGCAVYSTSCHLVKLSHPLVLYNSVQLITGNDLPCCT